MKLQKGIKIATALKYKIAEDDAPKVIASGQGFVAQNILEKANENKIPIYKDDNLARQLQLLQMGETIPEELYEAVAKVLIFISDIDMKYRQ